MTLRNDEILILEEKLPRQFVIPQGVRQELAGVYVITIFYLLDQLRWYWREPEPTSKPGPAGLELLKEDKRDAGGKRRSLVPDEDG